MVPPTGPAGELQSLSCEKQKEKSTKDLLHVKQKNKTLNLKKQNVVKKRLAKENIHTTTTTTWNQFLSGDNKSLQSGHVKEKPNVCRRRLNVFKTSFL